MWKAPMLGFLLLGLLAPTMFGQIGQQPGASGSNDVLARHVEGADLEYASTLQVFSKALLQAGAPGGIVRTSGCERDGVIHRWQPLGLSLRDVLDGIVKTDPQYRWSVEDKVINALPVAGEPTLLKTHIGEFRVENVAWANTALSMLIATPEVRASLNRLGLTEALKAGAVPLPNPMKAGRIVQCNNVTLREALNVIARAFGNAVWFYKERKLILDFVEMTTSNGLELVLERQMLAK